jgi:hypothetical protein
LDKKTSERRLAIRIPRINPIKLPKRFFKGIFFNPFSIRRVKAARKSPPIRPKRAILGEGENPLVKEYPLIPQMRNNKIRKIHEPNVFTSFPWMVDMRRHLN